jgi:prepilin-type N-terminal cleavage/methylation domain-containing protein
MKRSKEARAAFTLVEMLVVITIIGILAAITAKGVFVVLWGAKQTAIKTEVDSLSQALEQFKNMYGSYPPTDMRFYGSSTARKANVGLKAFISRAFSRYALSSTTDLALENELLAAGVDTTHFDPARALAFWLGGMGPDPTHPFRFGEPFTDSNSNGKWDSGEPFTDQNSNSKYDFYSSSVSRTPLFAFDKVRLKSGEPFVDANGNGQWDSSESYTDNNGDGKYDRYPEIYMSQYGAAPYVYYDYRSYTFTTVGSVVYSNGAGGFSMHYYCDIGTLHNLGKLGYVAPYALDADRSHTLTAAEAYADANTNGTFDNTESSTESFTDSNSNGYLDVGTGFDSWANPESFQIISAGQDGEFGDPLATADLPVRLYPDGKGYSAADADNVTNFNPKHNLEDAKP